MSVELSILDHIQANLGCGFMDAVMPLVTMLGNGGVIWIVTTLVLLCFPKTRKAGIAMAISLVLEALFCNLFLKPVVGRVRPCDVNTAFQLLIARPTDPGFPSGHTGASFAAASSLFFMKSRLAALLLVIAVLIGFSRLYLYVHYPSDVLAGAFIGIVFGRISVYLVNNIKRSSTDHTNE